MGFHSIDVVIGALKVLFSVFWKTSRIPSEFFFPIASDFWMLLCFYWLVSALKMKSVKAKESLGRRLSYLIPVVIGLTLLFNPRAHYSWLGIRFAPDTTALAVTGVVLTATGVALAMWARYCLGDNWSAAVSIREDHELVRRGPYRAMRHPIYSGILLGILGTVLVVGEVRGILGLVIVYAGFYGKARKEEAWLTREFGEKFASHVKHTGMFLPRFS